MKSVKQRVSELEEKYEESIKEKQAFKEQNAGTNDVEINFLKETSNQNKQEIYTTEEKIEKLEEEQSIIVEKFKENEMEAEKAEKV